MSKKNKIMGTPMDVTELVRRWGLQKIELQACRAELKDSTATMQTAIGLLNLARADNQKLRGEIANLRLDKQGLMGEAEAMDLAANLREKTIKSLSGEVIRLDGECNRLADKLTSADRWGMVWMLVATACLMGAAVAVRLALH